MNGNRRHRREDLEEIFAREDELFARDDDIFARAFEDLYERDDFEWWA